MHRFQLLAVKIKGMVVNGQVLMSDALPVITVWQPLPWPTSLTHNVSCYHPLSLCKLVSHSAGFPHGTVISLGQNTSNVNGPKCRRKQRVDHAKISPDEDGLKCVCHLGCFNKDFNFFQHLRVPQMPCFPWLPTRKAYKKSITSTGQSISVV